jgi:replicative DNA helicase
MLPLNQLTASKPKQRKKSYESYDKKREGEDPLRGVRIPPQDLEAERALLGSLLLSQEALYDIADMVTSESFYSAKHQIIFESIENLVNQKEPVDILTVSATFCE